MDDREFFDLLYQHWSKTTGAANTYWMPEEDVDRYLGGPHTWNVWAVNEKNEKQFISGYLEEKDADFIAAIHGCLADLIRCVNTALDESEKLDREADAREGMLAEAYLEVDNLSGQLLSQNDRLVDIEQEIKEANSFVDYLTVDNLEKEKALDDAYVTIR